MEAFTYKGISEGKYIEGDIEAINLDEASHLLKEKKIIITNINKSKKKKEGAKKKSSGSSIFGKKKVKVQEILIFSKQFATMVKAGLPILQVLIMLRDQLESPAIKEVIEDIRKSLEGGVNLSRCFEKYPQYQRFLLHRPRWEQFWGRETYLLTRLRACEQQPLW